MTNRPDRHERQAVQTLVDDLERAGEGHDEVRVADIVEAIGDDGLGALILVPALIMITPASGIPGLSTAGAVIILLAAIQMAAGRDTIWLPDFIRRQKMARSKLDKAAGWIEPPARWIDKVTRRRLTMLVRRPLSLLPLAICIGIACVVPVLEFIPFSASLAACAIAFFGLGFVAEDGLLVAVGLAIAAGVVWFVWWMVG
ncbi:exopolysaccharide biosynthesis protein [Aquibium microcysteis]|uniref:exopolysaccharide biosynthesis protein n=1 Tax=Aquibium microcysteis TaxID=675281 RepID=UPI00165D0EA6|nr:exopolysaccharide biosynthesis protein [Aquibium microcysteis]